MNKLCPHDVPQLLEIQSFQQLKNKSEETQDASDYCQNSPVHIRHSQKISQIGNYRQIQQIYCHGSNIVFLGIDKVFQQKIIIKKSYNFQKTATQLLHQMYEFEFLNILKGQKCKHLINIKQAIQAGNQQITIMEYGCKGDLQKNLPVLLSKQKSLHQRIQENTNILWQVILGLQQIHEKGYIYRDMKPSNIVFSHQGQVKLCDYGFVIRAGEIDTSICGTPQYMAPQRISEKKKTKPIDYSSDMWSLGILAYQLFMGKTPFEYDGDINDLIDQIYGGYIQLDQSLPEQIRHFILNLLQLNPSKRMSLQKAKNHKIFQQRIQYASFNFGCNCQQSQL